MVFLIIRDKCERVWRLKLKRMNKWISREANPQNKPCVEHMTRRRRVMPAWNFVSQVRFSREILAKHSVWLICHICFTKSLLTLYIPSLLTYCKECFQRKNPRKYTWELEIVIPTIIYTILCGFPHIPTFPYPYPWEIDSPNTYHTQSKWQVMFWCCWEALEEAKLWRMQSSA